MNHHRPRQLRTSKYLKTHRQWRQNPEQRQHQHQTHRPTNKTNDKGTMLYYPRCCNTNMSSTPPQHPHTNSSSPSHSHRHNSSSERKPLLLRHLTYQRLPPSPCTRYSKACCTSSTATSRQRTSSADMQKSSRCTRVCTSTASCIGSRETSITPGPGTVTSRTRMSSDTRGAMKQEGTHLRSRLKGGNIFSIGWNSIVIG